MPTSFRDILLKLCRREDLTRDEARQAFDLIMSGQATEAQIGGLLVGIPAAKPRAPFIAVGTQLVCTVRISHGAQNYLAFEGQVEDAAGVVWLTGAIQAYRPDNLEILGVTS